MTTTKYEAGVWEQHSEDNDGDGLTVWSRHTTESLARAAAVRYARGRNAPTGGALSWCGGYRLTDGGRVRWVTATGEASRLAQ